MAQSSTQGFLEFDNIREGIIVLKNRGLRAVLMVSSLNFALKSADEQNSILYQFQNFLNSLDFSCQIVMQSRRLNFTGYMEKLAELEGKETNELMKLQIGEYKTFIENILRQGTVMQKSFYMIIPFAPAEIQGEKSLKPSLMKPSTVAKFTEDGFLRYKTQLLQRVEFAALGLRSCGLEAVPLTTPELIELLWGLHHPLEAERGYYPDIPEELNI